MFPLSWGEALDRLTILHIKKEKVVDKDKLRHIQQEYSDVNQLFLEAEANGVFTQHELERFFISLLVVNKRLWKIEDDIRNFESRSCFGPEFVELARSVYKTNDQRFRIKNEFNQLTNSFYQEQKEYVSYENDGGSWNEK